MKIYQGFYVLMIVFTRGRGKATTFTDKHKLTRYSRKENFNEAKTFCSNQIATLPKVESKALKSAIAELMMGQKSDYWIGATDSEIEGTWKWTDGTNVNETNWKKGEPNNYFWSAGFGEDCATIQSNSKWNDESCSKDVGVICQEKIFSPEEKRHGIHWYTFHRGDNNIVTFDEAVNRCKQLNARLAEPLSSKTKDVVTQNSFPYFTDFAEYQNLWMGGKYIPQSNTWQWNSGSEISSGWNSNKGDGESSNHCLASSTSGWSSMLCTDRLPFICESVHVNNVVVSSKTAETDKGSDSVSCTADGVPTPAVSWYYGADRISSHSGSSVYQTTGDGRATIHFDGAIITDERVFSCWGRNTIKNISENEDSEIRLKVPSSPVINNVLANSCNSSLAITWTPNKRATGIRHRIRILGDRVMNESYSTPNAAGPYLFVATNLSAISLYNISITPCPGECKEEYTSTRDAVLSGGRPKEVRSVSVRNETDQKCVINWSAPVLVLENSIIDYQITVMEEIWDVGTHREAQSISLTSSISKTLSWILPGKPNRKYRFGIQARTCAGNGSMVKSDKYCITEKRGPDNVPKPQANSLVDKDGKVNLEISIPNQTNGPISCLFIVVKTKSVGTTLNQEMSLDNLKLMQINESNAENYTMEYIATAINVSSSTEDSKVVLLGDGKESSCDVYARTPRRQNQSQNARSDDVITGRNSRLVPQKYYEIAMVSTTPSILTVYLKTSKILHLNEIIFYTNNSPPANKGSDMTALLGVMIGLLLVILLAVAVIAWRRKRLTKHRNKESQDERDQLEDGEVIYLNSAFSQEREKQSDTEFAMGDLEEVFRHMKRNESAPFIEEFRALIREALSSKRSTEVASNPELKKKNRYRNILPYDDSRVIIRNSDSGYINACFVDGHQQNQKFIATQGPLASTCDDFWLMVVEQDCTVIVMLAKCVEAAKKKCQKYWPDLGKTQQFGSVTVTNQEEVRFCGFVQRTFRVAVNLQERETVVNVCQYHFTNWPDHGVPFTTSHLIRMHKEVMKAHSEAKTNSPIIVHCSAGAGRTGAFIAYDIVFNESKKQRTDVYKCVLNMRKQRVDMVQNCDQYILIHKLLLESYLFGDTDISADDCSKNFASDDYRTKVSAPQFDNLSRVTVMDTVEKNKRKDESPREKMKVRLNENGESDLKTSINATFVESYDEALKMIAFDGQTDETARNFWNVILQYNVSLVVTLNPTQQRFAQPWPLEVNASVQCKDVKITLRAETKAEHFNKRSLVVEGLHDTMEATQLKLLEGQIGLLKAKQFISVVEEVQRLRREQPCPIVLIHSCDGTESAGTFCAVVNLIERLKVEHRVDVFRTAKDLRDCTSQAVKTLDEYLLCHQAVIEYLSSFDVYVNFR